MIYEITQSLENDHHILEKLFKDALTTDDDQTRVALFHAIDFELLAHSEAEESILYPRLRREAAFRELAVHSEQEHQEIKQMLSQLRIKGSDEPNWKEEIAVLYDRVRHHMRQEEERIFPRMREVFTEAERTDLGHAVIGAREQVRRIGVSDRIARSPAPQTASMSR